MTKYNLPKTINVQETEYQITNSCDYRVVLDIMEVLKDEELNEGEQLYCAFCLFIGEDDVKGFNEEEIIEACKQMFYVINVGEKNETKAPKPQLMDWIYDFNEIVSAVSRVLGYDIRDEERITHWWSLIGAYKEVGECGFSAIIGIRKKMLKGKQLESWEREFCDNNPELIYLPRLSAEDRAWLEED